MLQNITTICFLYTLSIRLHFGPYNSVNRNYRTYGSRMPLSAAYSKGKIEESV
ncbi:hypothetical protein HMPREF0083_00335 [Aneurinibacillus aneurinilyticus ATCC 12856]|uniref:Uncharacterized protein n=1 Tax=Aneurinibacillus aneurinilyticus ATCC 12856 TaxID=649747 RepID=U1WSD7_ANEAE|nr:hypothetical protein HMPREF0083_00335 [Aneurinibacillus aneurinilyticus ATCC 12856]